MTLAARIAAPFWWLTGWLYGYRRAEREARAAELRECEKSGARAVFDIALYAGRTGSITTSKSNALIAHYDIDATRSRVFRGPQFYDKR